MNTLKELEQLEVGAPVRPQHPASAMSYPHTGIQSTVKPDFLPHPAVQWFAQSTGSPNSVEEPLSLLPDEICTAHLKPPTKKNNVT
ncbi:hypothetical protein OESDEN_16906 [Oesophagostomum dentatum]|uniref:Uncharacterized protein n=1 Tax=Oesophagostomum dentatum TaxID=61180 RepID=A0A0B1SIN4_OESDE|nr:hypothetical protein OESDEN_16906 [Oesophagostomum dentatum]